MIINIETLGKVSITVEEDYWDVNKDYEKLVVVERKDVGCFLSRKPVPKGTSINDREYWVRLSRASAMPISQDLGNNEDVVISQKTVTEHLGNIQNQIDNIVGEESITDFTISPNISFVGTSTDVTVTASCTAFANISIAKENEEADTQENVKEFVKTFEGITDTTTFVARFNVSGIEKPDKTAIITFVKPISYGYYANDTDTLTEMTTPKTSPVGQYTINIEEDASKIVFKVPSDMSIDSVMLVDGMSFPIEMDTPIISDDYKIYRSVSTFDSGEYIISVS